VDTSTSWGRWLTDVVKPYVDEVSTVLEPITSSTEMYYIGKSPEELIAEIHEVKTKSYKAVKSVAPPADLKAYHKKVLKLFKLMTKIDPREEEQYSTRVAQLATETNQIITALFTKKGVPQDIIDGIFKSSMNRSYQKSY